MLAFVYSGCSTDGDDPKDNGGEGSVNPDGTPTSYWNDDSARLGIQVREGTPTAFFLGDAKYYETGVNCYDLFVASITKHEASYVFDTELSFEMLRVLKKNGVSVVRFSCSLYYAEDMPAYLNQRSEFLTALKRVAAYAEELNIGIVPSLFWQYKAVPNYYNEPTRCWGRAGSQTFSFLKSYTRDIVTTLSEFKSVYAWEFGNELNLEADLPNWQDAFGTTNPDYWFKTADIDVAFSAFIDVVQTNDPASRAIISGHANLRNSQFNQYAYNNWNTDSTTEYAQITDLLTPAGMQVSEHIYEFTRRFSDLGEVNLDNRIRIAMNTAADLGKVYVIGEFGAPDDDSYRLHYDALVRNNVQLSFVWNFSILGNIEYSFTEESERGQLLFGLIRSCNAKYNNK